MSSEYLLHFLSLHGVGFTIADYDFFMALLAAVIIAVVTFFICFGGLEIGKKVGTKLAGKASILGGVILIFIGLEIFVTGVFWKCLQNLKIYPIDCVWILWQNTFQ